MGLWNKAAFVAILGVLAYFYLNQSSPVTKLASPIIDTKLGRVQGVKSVSRGGRTFFEYLGIPFAKPPVGQLRFESPQPAEKWKDVRQADQKGTPCLQMDYNFGSVQGSEDCLFLNVFTPKINTDQPLDVLFWIHGGSFHIGEGGWFGPEYFMDEDVVLVTVNYRLGALGFLSTEDAVVRGNMGLKDQSLALRWVRDNILNFGGNPNSVTIFGQSAGGASVHNHVISPYSKGLFHKAIAQSGVSWNPWAFRSHSSGKQAKRFGKILKCPTTESKKMVEYLKAASPEAIMEAHRDVVNVLRDPITLFVPVVEAVNDKDAFLAEHPVEIVKQGRASKVPFMAGVVSQEGLFSTGAMLGQSLLTKVKAEWDTVLPKLMFYAGEPNPEAMEKITQFYLGSRNNIDSEEKFQNLTNLFGDAVFNLGVHQAASLQSKYSPVYLYYYTYEGTFTFTDILFGMKGVLHPKYELKYFFAKRWIEKTFFGIEHHRYGACHVDEIALLFPLRQRGTSIRAQDKDFEMSRDLVSLWVDFAKDDKTMRFKGRSWPSVDPTERTLKYLHLHPSQPRIIDEPYAERMAFWNSLNIKSIN